MLRITPFLIVAIVAPFGAAAADPTAPPERIEPINRITVPAEIAVDDIALTRDGRYAYLFGHRNALRLTAVLEFYWRYVLAAGLMLIGAVALWRLWRIGRRPRLRGEPYCRRCNASLAGITGPTCPACRRPITGRRRVIGRSPVPGIVIALIVLFAAGNAAVWLWDAERQVASGLYDPHVWSFSGDDPRNGYSTLAYRLAAAGNWRIIETSGRSAHSVRSSHVIYRLNLASGALDLVFDEKFEGYVLTDAAGLDMSPSGGLFKSEGVILPKFMVHDAPDRIVALLDGRFLILDPRDDSLLVRDAAFEMMRNVLVSGDGDWLFVHARREVFAYDLKRLGPPITFDWRSIAGSGAAITEIAKVPDRPTLILYPLGLPTPIACDPTTGRAQRLDEIELNGFRQPSPYARWEDDRTYAADGVTIGSKFTGDALTLSIDDMEYVSLHRTNNRVVIAGWEALPDDGTYGYAAYQLLVYDLPPDKPRRDGTPIDE